MIVTALTAYGIVSCIAALVFIRILGNKDRH